MIVNEVENGFEIIYQNNHSLLAGAIALQIQEKYRPPFWPETLTAILQHDDGQRDWNEGNFVSEDGRPIDFTEYDFDLKQAQRITEQSRYKSKWIQLLIVEHTIQLYSDADPKPEELKKFLSDQKKRKTELLEYFDLEEKRFVELYKFMRWCDELSLLLCRNDTKQKQEIAALPGEHDENILISQQNLVSVDPWCFSVSEFTLEAEVHIVESKYFQNENELFKKLLKIAPIRRSWRFKKL